MSTQCVNCPKKATAPCGMHCAEHDSHDCGLVGRLIESVVERPRYPKPDGGPSLNEYLRSRGEL